MPEIRSLGENEKQKRGGYSLTEKYINHPSTTPVKSAFPPKEQFQTESALVEQVNKVVRSLNVKKSTEPDENSINIFKMTADDARITNVINISFSNN